jgi:hypothetical protein
MGDAEKNPAPVFETDQGAPEEGRNWLPMSIGAALVIIIVAVIVFVAHSNSSKGRPAQGDPYAAKIQISNLHMATAENFAGGSVTYIEGKLANSGDKKLTAASVEVLFKNSLGEVAQKEFLPVMVLLPNTPYTDYGPLDRAPLAPGQSRDFRLTLEHISADWDGQVPQVRVVGISTS